MYQYAVCGGEVGRGAPSYDFAIFCGKPYYSIKNNLALREGSPGYLPPDITVNFGFWSYSLAFTNW